MDKGVRAPRLRLGDRVSAGNDADPKDVLATKKALVTTGFLQDDPEVGSNGFVNRELIQGVEEF